MKAFPNSKDILINHYPSSLYFSPAQHWSKILHFHKHGDFSGRKGEDLSRHTQTNNETKKKNLTFQQYLLRIELLMVQASAGDFIWHNSNLNSETIILGNVRWKLILQLFKSFSDVQSRLIPMKTSETDLIWLLKYSSDISCDKFHWSIHF